VARVPPDLAIEIFSPGTAQNDRGRKKDLLARHGVREYWLVDPDPVSIEVMSLHGDRFTTTGILTGSARLESPLLPALRLSPADLVPA
jgi:Uma2 family endonuclease